MKEYALPARVRVSRLEAAPNAALRGTLRKLDPTRAPALEAAGPGQVVVALAGGAPIGYALWHGAERVVVLSRSWLNQGIEAALEGSLGAAPSQQVGWTALEPAGCDPLTGICEVPGGEVSAPNGWTVIEATAGLEEKGERS